MTPQYTSANRIFFAVQAGESVSDLAQGSTFTEKQMSSYAEVARSPIVLDPVRESLNLDLSVRELSDTLSISVAADTTILVISAMNEDPVLARDIANAVADQLADTAASLSPERPDGSEAVRATMLSEADTGQSWAGLCPGNNESAGKRFSGHTRSGNTWLCGTLGDCATAAARTKNTYIAERHRRLQRRRGRKRAKVAISRTILESAWWVMSNDIDYADLGPEHFLTHARNPARRANRLTLELRALGYDVTLPARVPR